LIRSGACAASCCWPHHPHPAAVHGAAHAADGLDVGTGPGHLWRRALEEWSLDAYVQFLYERDLDDSLTLNSDYLQIFGRSFCWPVSPRW
jgi:hypothetical protein